MAGSLRDSLDHLQRNTQTTIKKNLTEGEKKEDKKGKWPKLPSELLEHSLYITANLITKYLLSLHGERQ